MFNFLKKKNTSPVVSGDIHTLKTDRRLVREHFIKQNLLGLSASVFALFFSFVLKDIMLSKTFTIADQVLFVFFFCLSMSLLTLMLFQLKDSLLMWWIGGYLVCSLLLFIDILSFTNIFLYLSLIIVFVYLLFIAKQYHKSDTIYLKFNWKTIFRSGFSHQFFSSLILLMIIFLFGFLNIGGNHLGNWTLGSIAQAGFDTWNKLKPDSSLNKTLDEAIDNFLAKNPIVNNLEKQSSFLGVNSEKLISNSIKTIFKNNNNHDLKLSQIAVNYLERASTTTQLIIFGAILWIFWSFISLFYFISRTLVYYFTFLIIQFLIFIHFFKFKEKPAIQQVLTL